DVRVFPQREWPRSLMPGPLDRGDDAPMTYAVVVSANDGPEHPGRLELEPDCLRFSGGHPIRYSDLGDVYVERRSGGSDRGRPAPVVISPDGRRMRIPSTVRLRRLCAR